jgi:hypothetical protein
MNAFKSLLVLAVAALSVASCRKEPDAPAIDLSSDPGLPVNMTIRDLKTRFAGPGTTRIDSNWTIYGIVTADDRSGNLYQQINIEDSTGGITLLVGQPNLYTSYPRGRKVYVKLKGLHYGFYNLYPQIGFTPNEDGELSNIPVAGISDYIVKAGYPHTVTPQTFTDLSALRSVNNAMINRLIRIEGVEFIDSDTGKTYAQAPTISSGTDRKIQDCFGNQVVVRTSGYASFSQFKLPTGRGGLTAIYSIYRSTPQLIIVDTADVDLYGLRCAAGPAPVLPKVSIDSLRRRFAASGATTLGPTQITGVVISNRLRENLDARNLVLQQGDRGIVVRFSAQHTFNQGDSLVIDASGQSLSEFRALLQVSGSSFSTAKAQRAATGKTVTPQTLTIAQIVGAAFEMYESTLVRIVNATASGGSTYYQSTSPFGNRTLTDGSGGSITLYTDGDATFGGATLPSGPRTWVGIIGQYDATKQFSIRDTTDVQ